jgi:hypothetical protein
MNEIYVAVHASVPAGPNDCSCSFSFCGTDQRRRPGMNNANGSKGLDPFNNIVYEYKIGAKTPIVNIKFVILNGDLDIFIVAMAIKDAIARLWIPILTNGKLVFITETVDIADMNKRTTIPIAVCISLVLKSVHTVYMQNNKITAKNISGANILSSHEKNAE